MADEYIRKQDAIIEMMDNDVDHAQGADGREVVQILEDIPAADVAPVVHSRWIKTADGAMCEKCGREVVYMTIFCPHCGARMDGKREE